MDVVSLPEFARCMRSFANSGADARQVEGLLHRLSAEHATPDMQADRVQVPGADIVLWATHELQLSGGSSRVTWRYEEQDGYDVIVCFTLVQV